MLKGILRAHSNFHLQKLDKYFKEKYGVELDEIKEIKKERQNQSDTNKLYEGKCFISSGLYKTRLICILQYIEGSEEFIIRVSQVDCSTANTKTVKYEKEKRVPVDYIISIVQNISPGYLISEEVSFEKYNETKKEIKLMYDSIKMPNI